MSCVKNCFETISAAKVWLTQLVDKKNIIQSYTSCNVLIISFPLEGQLYKSIQRFVFRLFCIINRADVLCKFTKFPRFSILCVLCVRIECIRIERETVYNSFIRLSNMEVPPLVWNNLVSRRVRITHRLLLSRWVRCPMSESLNPNLVRTQIWYSASLISFLSTASWG